MKLSDDIPETNIRRLAAQVVLKAIEEARAPDPLLALDAISWLAGSDFGLWAEVANIPFADPLELLTSGKVRTVRTKAKGILSE